MNPEVNVTAHLNRVGAESEATYNDEFFDSLDGVANALDNIEARIYMDKRCVYHRLPLLESGTLGTKGNVQVVVPFMTESYGSSQDPPEQSIPICTVNNFPYTIEHTLQWAQDTFRGLFTEAAESAYKFVEDRDCTQHALLHETYTSVRRVLAEKPKDFKECVGLALNYFKEYFQTQIQHLLDDFPADTKSSGGQYFWAYPKRLPTALAFDKENPLHLDFVIAAANVFAEVNCFF
jgi:ubiquitin-activating enzyme E1